MNTSQSPVINHFHQPMTAWKNPTDQPVTVRVPVGHDNVPPPARPYRRGEPHANCIELSWGPGDVMQIPTIYDRAIHDVRNGVIVGGGAPQLQKVGEPPLQLAAAIDVEGAKEKQALVDAQTALAAKTVAENALVVASAKAQAASEAIAAREADTDPAKKNASKKG